MMRVFALVGTMKPKKSNTAALCNRFFEQLDKDIFHGEAEYECLTLSQLHIDWCISCDQCFKTGECVRREVDDLHILQEKMLAADIILVGSPVYMGSVSGCLKNVIDRLSVWNHVMKLTGKLLIPVVTASSNHVQETLQFMKDSFIRMGAIMPTEVYGYVDSGSPMLTEPEAVEAFCAERAAILAEAIGNRSKFITKLHRQIYQFNLMTYGPGLRMHQMLGTTPKGEPLMWQNTGLPAAGSFEKYCWENYPHGEQEEIFYQDRYFTPELADWTGARKHYACFTYVVHGLEKTLWLMEGAELLDKEAKEDLVKAYAHRVELITAFVMESRLVRNRSAKNFATMFFPEALSEEEKLASAEALYEEYKDSRKPLYKEYPRLRKLLKLSQMHFLLFIGEFLHAFNELIPQLEKEFFAGRRCSRILRLKCDMGDSHNQGKVTMLVETDAGKCVYKPHDLSIDIHAHAFLAKHFGQYTAAPKAVKLGDVGFCEYIENQPAATPAEAKEFYYNLGGLSAVLYLLGSTDYHEENVLVRDRKPMPIDLETIINPTFEFGTDRKQSSFAEDVGRSIYKSGLGPFLLGDRNISLLHDTSEENCAAPVIDGQRITIQGYEDDLLQGFREAYAYCLEHRDSLLEDLQVMAEDKLRVVVRGTQPYCELLYKTYQTGWLKRKDISEDVEKALSRGKIMQLNDKMAGLAKEEAKAICRGDIPYFYVLADGSSLMSQDAEAVPEYCQQSSLAAIKQCLQNMSQQDMELQCSILSIMCRKVLVPLETDTDTDAETEAAAEIGVSAETEAETKAKDETEVEAKVEIENEDKSGDKAAQRQATAVAAGIQAEGQGAGYDLAKISLLTKAEKIEAAQELFEKIVADGITGMDGKLYWFGLDEKRRTAGMPQSNGLLNGHAGMGMFFGALAKVTANKATGSKASALAADHFEALCASAQEIHTKRQQLLETGNKPLPIPLGLGEGIGGLLLGTVLLGRYLNRIQEAQQACQKLLSVMQDVALTDYLNIWDGRAGLLWTLCHYDELWQLPEAPDFAAKLLEQLLEARTADDPKMKELQLWPDNSLKRPLSGYSKGQAGFAMALCAAAERLESQEILQDRWQAVRQELQQAVEQAISFEAGIYLTKEAGWPSLEASRFNREPAVGLNGGTSGVGLAMLHCQSQSQQAADNLARALDLTMEQGLLREDSLAQGNCLAVELLLLAAKAQGKAAYQQQAEKIMAAMVARAKAQGEYCYLEAGFQNMFVASLLDGAAGIGYELLRMAEPEKIYSIFA